MYRANGNYLEKDKTNSQYEGFRRRERIMEIILLMWAHFIGDFLLQNDKMALNKSKSNLWLGIHSLVYSLPLVFFGFQFAVFNGIFHYLIDWVTSRGTTKLWLANERHWFFVLIGFDQTIHVTILLLSYSLTSVLY